MDELDPAEIARRKSANADRVALQQRKAGLESDLIKLRQERATATLERRNFDHGRIATVEQALVGLDDALALHDKRQSEVGQELKASRVPVLMDEIAALEEQRLGYVTTAETAVRAFVEAVSVINALADEQRQRVATLNGHLNSDVPPDNLDSLRITDRLGNLLSITFEPIAPGGNFGGVRMAAQAHHYVPSADSWVDVARAAG